MDMLAQMATFVRIVDGKSLSAAARSQRLSLPAVSRQLRAHGVPREPAQLARRTCLVQVTPAGVPVRWQLRRGDVEHTIDVRGSVRSNAPLALRDLALDGAGIAYLPDWLVSDDLERGRLRRVLPEWASA